MQIVGSKAFYLKNSTRTRARTEHREPTRSPRDPSHLSDLTRIRNLSNLRTQDALTTDNWEPPRYQGRHSTKLQTIQEKEQELIERVCRWRLAESRRRQSKCESVTVERHPIAEVNSLEFESMKPTDRYFQQVENIRLAERLLLAKPSRDIERTSQQKFYMQQEAYRLNITKLSSRQPHPHPRAKPSLHRRKWID